MSSESAFTTGLHLRGDVAPDVRWYPDGIQSQPNPYASVSFDGLTVFINEPGQAQPLADAFAGVAAHFGTEPVRSYVIRQARETVAEFRAWLETPAGELVWCENPDHPQEDAPHAPRDDCKFPHNSGRYADQFRYAEFAGRLAALLAELTDPPGAEGTK